MPDTTARRYDRARGHEVPARGALVPRGVERVGGERLIRTGQRRRPVEPRPRGSAVLVPHRLDRPGGDVDVQAVRGANACRRRISRHGASRSLVGTAPHTQAPGVEPLGSPLTRDRAAKLEVAQAVVQQCQVGPRLAAGLVRERRGGELARRLAQVVAHARGTALHAVPAELDRTRRFRDPGDLVDLDPGERQAQALVHVEHDHLALDVDPARARGALDVGDPRALDDERTAVGAREGQALHVLEVVAAGRPLLDETRARVERRALAIQVQELEAFPRAAIRRARGLHGGSMGRRTVAQRHDDERQEHHEHPGQNRPQDADPSLRGHRPGNRGSRLSRKACVPSRMSSVAKHRANSADSRRRASACGVSLPDTTASSARAIASMELRRSVAT